MPQPEVANHNTPLFHARSGGGRPRAAGLDDVLGDAFDGFAVVLPFGLQVRAGPDFGGAFRLVYVAEEDVGYVAEGEVDRVGGGEVGVDALAEGAAGHGGVAGCKGDLCTFVDVSMAS